MVQVATPKTEAEWIEYAMTHRVNQVEARVAATKPGEGPKDRRWGRRTQRYPYRFLVGAEVHEAFEALSHSSG
jgi:hypothetical protein